VKRLPRRLTPLERLGVVERYASDRADGPMTLREQIERLADRIADVTRRLDDVERRLRP
jgi:flagellar capping protein FliD